MEPKAIFVGFQLFVLLFSVIIHEISHGAMALYLGDDTAKRLGRLTLNPLKHLDSFGSVILPLMLVIVRSPFLIGWAKPVPYNPYNLANPKKGAALIAIAGPFSNIVLAIIFTLLLHLPLTFGLGGETLVFAFGLIIILNLLLALFNLVPIPPLDGSKLLFFFMPNISLLAQRFLEMYGFFIILFFIFFFFRFLWLAVIVVFSALLFLAGLDPNAVFNVFTTFL